MKKLIILLTAIVLTISPAWSEIDTFVGVESIDTYVGVESIDEVVGVTIASSAACTLFIEDLDAVTADFDIHDNAGTYYTCQRYTNAASKTICQMDLLLSEKAGNLDAKTFTASVWTMTGDNLNANQGNSDAVDGELVTGTPGTGTWVEFPFSTPVSTTGTTEYAYCVTMDGAADASNYAEWEVNGNDTDFIGWRANYESDGTETSHDSESEMCLKIYDQ